MASTGNMSIIVYSTGILLSKPLLAEFSCHSVPGFPMAFSVAEREEISSAHCAAACLADGMKGGQWVNV